MRRRKASISRPFPSGFTPVVPRASPSDQAQKQKEFRPTFLPPTLLSPLPPLEQERSNVTAPIIGGCRSPKTPISVMSSFRTTNKLVPTIKQIYRYVRYPPRQPTRPDSYSRSSSPIPSFCNQSGSECSRFPSVQPQLSHSTPPAPQTCAPFLRRRLKSSFSARDRLCDLDKRTLWPQVVANTPGGRGELSLRRGRSFSTGLKPSEWSNNSSFSSLPRYQLDQDMDSDKVILEISSSGRPLRPPPVASDATEQSDYASYLRVEPDELESVVSPVLSATNMFEPINLSSYPDWPSCESRLADTVTPIPKKIPDSVLDDWEKWRRDLLSKYFPPS